MFSLFYLCATLVISSYTLAIGTTILFAVCIIFSFLKHLTKRRNKPCTLRVK